MKKTKENEARLAIRKENEHRKTLHKNIRKRVESTMKPGELGTIIGVEGENNGMNTVDPYIVRWDNDRNNLKANQNEKGVKIL